MRAKTIQQFIVILCLFVLSNFHMQGSKLDTIKQTFDPIIFQKIKVLCDRDSGKLWGINLNAPILCIDSHRNIFSNEKDPQGNLNWKDGVYQGKYPLSKNIANSTTEVFGKKWVMAMLPLPDDSLERNILFIHEIFHYWQDSLKLEPDYSYNNKHIDRKDARILLKLEWEALRQACLSENLPDRLEHLKNGLSFRAYRHHLFPDYKQDEIAFEIQEGLAQYTGMKICSGEDCTYKFLLDRHFTAYMQKDELIRAFAYFSGELYGYLLDKSGIGWRNVIKKDTDMGNLLQNSYHIQLPPNLPDYCQKAKRSYAFRQIENFESERDSLKRIEQQRYQELFTHHVLKLPIQKINIKFNPNSLQSVEGLGTIYKEVRIVDEWGILETVNGGCLMISDDWKTILLPFADQIEQPQKSSMQTHFWKLELKPDSPITPVIYP